MVIGLKMGVTAKNILKTIDLCRIQTIQSKPYTCTLDGVKTVLNRVETHIEKGNGVAATFKGEGEQVRIYLKREALEYYGTVTWRLCREYAIKALKENDENLFILNRTIV